MLATKSLWMVNDAAQRASNAVCPIPLEAGPVTAGKKADVPPLTYGISASTEIPRDRMMPECPDDRIARFADMLAALGTEPRLRIIRLLLAARPEGMVVGEI